MSSAMATEDPYKSLNNKERVYASLHDHMMQLFETGKFKEAIRVAEKLLMKAHLPLLIRARCHMLFARRLGSAFAVEHGERAVEILDSEVFRDQTLEEAYPQWHLDEARDILQAAKDRAAKDAATKLPAVLEGVEAQMALEAGAGESKKDVATRTTKHGYATPGGVSRTATGQSQHGGPSAPRGPGPELPTPHKEDIATADAADQAEAEMEDVGGEDPEGGERVDEGGESDGMEYD